MDAGAETHTSGGSALATHDAAVARLSRQIADFHRRQVPFRIFHGNTNSTRLSERTWNGSVDISSLDNVVSVCAERRICLVEPNVPMDRLVTTTLAYGLVPPVVPEFPGITVGGGFSGTAGESSSFRYGFFDRTVSKIEVILADGEVVMASEAERADLLRGMAGTFGSLGVATLFEIQLIPAKEYVELAYIRVDGIEDAQRAIRQVKERGDADFLDGIMFSPDSGVIMAGRLADRDEKNKDFDVVTFTRPWDLWFYLHAEERMNATDTAVSASSSSHPQRDLIPLTDYLFRYDRGAFWTGRFAYTYFYVPFTRSVRWLADRFMHTRIMYHALHRSGLYQRFIIQDMALPNKNIPEFSRWLDLELPHIYPRWLCPLRTGEPVSMHPHARAPASGTEPGGDNDDEALLNIGVWGETPSHMTQLGINRRIEAKLRCLHGMKWLYAQTFYTADEFWQIYDGAWYEGIRRKYRAEGLPSVYEKVRTRFDVDAQGRVVGDGKLGIEKGLWRFWPLAGVYGVLSALKGGDYLRKK